MPSVKSDNASTSETTIDEELLISDDVTKDFSSTDHTSQHKDQLSEELLEPKTFFVAQPRR